MQVHRFVSSRVQPPVVLDPEQLSPCLGSRLVGHYVGEKIGRPGTFPVMADVEHQAAFRAKVALRPRRDLKKQVDERC